MWSLRHRRRRSRGQLSCSRGQLPVWAASERRSEGAACLPNSGAKLTKTLTLSRTDWHLGCERSRSPSADRPVRGRCSPARRQLKPTLGRAIDWHRCSLPQRVQLSGRLPASCLQVAEQRRSCPALDGGGQLWLEEGGRFEAAAARVSFRGCQHAARSPVPCLVRRLPVTCSSSRRVLTPW